MRHRWCSRDGTTKGHIETLVFSEEGSGASDGEPWIPRHACEIHDIASVGKPVPSGTELLELGNGRAPGAGPIHPAVEHRE